MLPLTREDLLPFELLCDAEGVLADEREAMIRALFGEEAAAAYVSGRGKVIPFSGRRPEQQPRQCFQPR